MARIHFNRVERAKKDKDRSCRPCYANNSPGDLEEGNHLNFLNLIFHIYKVSALTTSKWPLNVKLKGEKSGI
jgi:hypothetical protein